MWITMEARTPCLLCGYRHRVIRTGPFRVNKRSLRSLGGLVSVGTHFCPECGTRNAGQLIPVSPYRLLPDDASKVTAYRQRKWGCA